MKVEEPVTDEAEKEESQEEKESQNVSAETVPEVMSDPEEEQIKDTSELQTMETVSDLIVFVSSMNSLVCHYFLDESSMFIYEWALPLKRNSMPKNTNLLKHPQDIKDVDEFFSWELIWSNVALHHLMLCSEWVPSEWVQTLIKTSQ